MLLFFLVLSSVFVGGLQAGKPEKSPRIVGGDLTTIAEAPYLVQLRDITGRFFCAGSLVKPTIVVTAAHCLDTTEQRHIVVVGGATTIADEGVEARIAQKFVHPKYVRASFTHDVAVIKLATPILGSNIKTIPLCKTAIQPGEFLQVYGWGYTSEDKSVVSNQVRTVRIPTFSFEKCREMYSESEITESMMCGSVPGVKDACTTDSGGPAVHHGELCGVVSWGTGCARKEYPGVYTNVTTIRSFIYESMQK